jgi:peptide deformylase
MYREIVKWPSRSLKQKSSSVVFGSLEHAQVIQDLKDTFRAKAGYGLAAPQIGFNLRVITVNPAAIGLGDDYQAAEQLVMINPQVQYTGDLVFSKEACFSIPGITEIVKRYQRCSVSFIDEEGASQAIELTDLAAFCIQHEIDHLDGILFIDHLSRLKKSIAMKKQKKFLKRREDVRKQMKREFDEDAALYEDGSENNTRRKSKTSKDRKKLLISKQSRKKNRAKKKK